MKNLRPLKILERLEQINVNIAKNELMRCRSNLALLQKRKDDHWRIHSTPDQIDAKFHEVSSQLVAAHEQNRIVTKEIDSLRKKEGEIVLALLEKKSSLISIESSIEKYEEDNKISREKVENMRILDQIITSCYLSLI